jgi:hypothetical protein
LNCLKEARTCLVIAFNECHESKHLKLLEKELFDLTGVPVRPKPHDFDTLDELGDGNFTKIYKAIHKPTQTIYAIKVWSLLLLPSFSYLLLCFSLTWTLTLADD